MAKPNVSKNEFRKVRSALASKGYSKTERNDLEAVFRGDLAETGFQSGITSDELKKGVKWLKENKSKHSLSDNEIAEAERLLKERL
ncbi:hypothetical protein ACFLY5_00385 [Patescibacteria group bacterium]